MKRPYEIELTLDQLAALSDADIDFSDIPETEDMLWLNAIVQWPEQPSIP